MGRKKSPLRLLTGSDVTNASKTPPIRSCTEDAVWGTAVIDATCDQLWVRVEKCCHPKMFFLRFHKHSQTKLLIVEKMRPPGKMFLSSDSSERLM